jgi:hypothetical protein
MSGVIKEWNCLLHGEFDGTHPICPSHGCRSLAVVREFRTAPTVRSNGMKKFDAGIRRTADMMKLGNLRTARAGEAAYGGDAAKQKGLEILWGQDVQKTMGHSFAELASIAQRPLTVPRRDGSAPIVETRNNGMRGAATEAGITGRRLPQIGELAMVRSDAVPDAKVKALTT